MVRVMIGKYRFIALIISGIIIALAGLLARITNDPNIEHWFVFAAGLSNMIVLFEIGPEIFQQKYDRSARLWLTFELLFFSVILGTDISLAFGHWDEVLLFFALSWVLFAMFFIALSDTPHNQIGFLVSALCLVVSLYLMPPLFRYLTPNWEHPFWILISNRGYAWIHLLGIPFIYLLVDSKLSKKHNKWSNFLFLDRSLALAGTACAISGVLYALFGPTEGTPPLFESGAAALLLLVGNAWYISIAK